MNSPLSLLALLGLVACSSSTVEGSGRMVEQTRTVSAFSGVSLENGLSGTLSLGPTSVRLRLDENLINEVRSEVDTSTLRVACRDGLDIHASVGSAITLSAPQIDALAVSGGASLVGEANGQDIRLDATDDSRLTVRAASNRAQISATGGSTVSLSGEAHQLFVDASGGAVIDSVVASEEAEIEASGGAHVTVHASTRVRIMASGSSQVIVIGSPTSRDLDVSGEATVLFQ